MMNCIAVALDSVAQAKRIAPYLSSVARPGVKIDFLILAKARRPVWLLACTTALSLHNRSSVAVFEQRWGFEVEEERLQAERKLANLSEWLRHQGAESTVRVYSGSLKRMLGELRESAPGSFVVLHPQKDWLLKNAVRAILTKTGLRAPIEVSRASLAIETHS